MADAADSKSVCGDTVRVQVPPPAVKKMLETLIKCAFLEKLFFTVLITLDNSTKNYRKGENSFMYGVSFLVNRRCYII